MAFLAACVPGSPDADTWRSDARLALSDVASEVATVGLVLEQDAEERFLGGYAAVVATDAEEAAGKAIDGFAAAQPPEVEEQRFAEVTAALDEAAGLVTDARIAIVDSETAEYTALARDLEASGRQLDRLERELRRPPGGGR